MKKEPKRFEAECQSYGCGKSVTYARVREKNGYLYRGRRYSSLQQLLDAEGSEPLDRRVNRRCIRTFSVRIYDTLRFYDQKPDETVVLIDEDTYDHLT